MARARATPRAPYRRARAVTFLSRACHRFLATRCHRRASTGGSSPSSQPPLARTYYISTPRGRGAEVAQALRRASTGDSSPPLARASPAPRRGRDTEVAEAPGAAAAAEAQPPHEEQQGDEDAAASEAEAAVAGKYWAQRHSLFSIYDRGVRMDAEGWYSATPEVIAAAQAVRAPPGSLVLDAFAGVGGNCIQFAARGCYVVAVEIDPRKVELAAHNARIYGVEDRIEFVVGDFFHLAPFLKADLVFLSPPWGGPSYCQAQVYTLDMLRPKDGYAIFQAAQEISPNIIMFLPRTVDISQVEQLSWLSSPPLDFVSEENYIEHEYFKGITAYFGGMAQQVQKQEQISCQGFNA